MLVFQHYYHKMYTQALIFLVVFSVRYVTSHVEGSISRDKRALLVYPGQVSKVQVSTYYVQCQFVTIIIIYLHQRYVSQAHNSRASDIAL